jgi:anti-anti-sigma factor
VTAASSPYQLEVSPTHAIVTLQPEISQARWADVEKVGGELLASLESNNGTKAWLIDLSPLDYMGSAQVALLVRLWKAVQNRGGRVVVVCAEGVPEEVLRLAGLNKVWTIVRTRPQGLKQLGVLEGGGTEPKTPVVAVLGLLFSLAAVVGLLLLWRGASVPRSVLLTLLYGGAAAAVLLGLISAVGRGRTSRALGVAAALAGVVLTVVGYLRFPP